MSAKIDATVVSSEIPRTILLLAHNWRYRDLRPYNVGLYLSQRGYNVHLLLPAKRFSFDEENGFIIEAGDVDALADRICRLVESPNRRRAMAVRNREKAAREFNIERVANDLGDVFLEATGAK